jgi:formyltetrahydrofolate synthetase
LDLPIEEKITAIARDIYRADGIELSDLAKQQIETYTRQGYGNLPSSYLRPIDLRCACWCAVRD